MGNMKRWLKEHSLGIVLFAFFLIFLWGQSMAGHRHYNQEQVEHTQPILSYTEYLTTGDFIEATFENWESEFLQMGAYVILTVFLYQKGSAESKKLQGKEPVDAKPLKSKYAPWPIRMGGIAQKLYENSLSLAFLVLFLTSFWLHAYGGARATCQEDWAHGQHECLSTVSYLGTSKFWSESLQNWQSEFLAVCSIVVLSVYLRQRGSPESKPVNAPNDKTGTE
jgi:hypothetical protein